MKKTNKGFSLVELIIVIAIMAILAGALAPALIKYINKSRISTDIQTASAIATACQAAIASEKGYDAASNGYAAGKTITDIYSATDDCAVVIQNTCGAQPKLKAKKCDGTACSHGGTYNGDFFVKIDTAQNTIEITENGGGHVLYPNADSCLTD